MKKLMLLCIILLLALSLVACDSESGAGGRGSGEESTQPSIGDINFAAIFSGNADVGTIWGLQDPASQQAIIEAGRKEGVDVSFGADGSMAVVDPETGDTVIQKPDGTWTIKGSDGSEGQFGGNWPKNEFTEQLPTPAFELMAASTTETDFSVAFVGASVEDIRAYVEAAKSKGFTVDAETSDEETMGMVIYSFTAENASGYELNVFYAVGTSGLTLTKPDPDKA